MFKEMTGSLWLNHDLIQSVQGGIVGDPHVIITMVSGEKHALNAPEGVTAQEHALKLVSDMNQAKRLLIQGSAQELAKALRVLNK